VFTVAYEAVYSVLIGVLAFAKPLEEIWIGACTFPVLHMANAVKQTVSNIFSFWLLRILINYRSRQILFDRMIVKTLTLL